MSFLDTNGVKKLIALTKDWATGLFVQKVAGKGLSTNDYTTTEKNKLAGLANYTHPTGDGNMHVPATNTTNSGKVLKAGATAGSAAWGTLSKSDVGLGNVDNTSDANKPVSTATKTALDGKAALKHTHGDADITSLNASKLTGMIDIARLPQGALERCVVVADDTARKALTTSQVQIGDTVKVTSTGLMYFVVDDTKLATDDGYEVYTAGSATSVPWSGVTGKPSTFTPSTHTHTKSQISDFPTALKNPTALTFTGGVTGTYDGSAAKTVAIPTALKCPAALTLQFNGTSQGAFDGSAAKTLNITPAAIGALSTADLVAITDAEIEAMF